MKTLSEAAKKLRIVFMGTPEFAVESLKSLLEAGAQIVAVVTAPDKPAGRGMELQQSAVKVFALQNGIEVLQPVKLKDENFLSQLKSLKPDVQVVVAFRMLPELVWNLPHMGTLNVHASLLPQYRGAAPINWAIINGEKETGVTTFKLKHEIDTGNILLQQKIIIGPEENAGSLHDRLMKAGAELIVETLERLAEGNLEEKAQDHIDNRFLRHGPKIFTETCKIDWNRTSEEIFNLIRGLSPYPAAFTELNGKKLKIFSAKVSHDSSRIKPGEISTDNKHYFRIATNDGFIEIIELQLEGKKRMKTEDFLRGYRV